MLPRILFPHVPKTGGVALYRALERVYGPDRSMQFAHGGGEIFRADPSQLRAARLISGHEYFPNYLACGLGDAFKVSVVRDPAERAVSAYNYCRSLPTHPKYETFMALSPDQWVEKIERREAVHSEQLMVLSGEATMEAARPLLDTYNLLIPYPLLADGVDRLSEAIGVRLTLERHNETDMANALVFSDALRTRIRNALSDERELLAYANARWADFR